MFSSGSAGGSGWYLQTVIQGKVLGTFSCGEQQVTRALRLGSFMSRHLGILHRCRLQILPDPNKLLPGLRKLREEPEDTNTSIRTPGGPSGQTLSPGGPSGGLGATHCEQRLVSCWLMALWVWSNNIWGAETSGQTGSETTVVKQKNGLTVWKFSISCRPWLNWFRQLWQEGNRKSETITEQESIVTGQMSAGPTEQLL